MAQVAYDLDRFAGPQRQAAPRVRVAKGQQTARQAQLLKMVKTLAVVVVMGLLVSAVLYTQATITELQGEITAQEKLLSDEKSLNAYLTFELDNMTSLKNIEQRAAEMGMEKVNNGQIVYFRTGEGETIQVRESFMDTLLNKARSSWQSILDYISPQ